MSARKCRRCGATSGLRRLMGSPLSLDGAEWECDGGCPREPLGDHPHTDPGDGRTECDLCGKFVWPAIHSCKGVPVTEAARQRAEVRALRTANERLQAMHREALDRNAPMAGELRDRRTEDLALRGVLSPNGLPRVVPVELGESVVPAVEWLVAEVERLTLQLGEATVKAAVTTGPTVTLSQYDLGDLPQDGPEAVEVELQRLATETGEPIEVVRAAYRRACGDGDR